MTVSSLAPKQIAIIGGGVAGLTAAHLLHRRHKVTLFEKESRLGGNAYTHTTASGQDVDIAVAAFGKAGYQHFYGLMHQLGIDTAMCPTSYMSFHSLDSQQGLYLTLGADALRVAASEILQPRSAWTVLQLFRGVRSGIRLLESGALDGLSFAQALDRVPSLRGDARLILICALCLMSSMSSEQVLSAPASFFFNKLRTHNDVVSPKAVYSVRCVRGFTRSYVDALAAPYYESIQQSRTVTRVVRNDDEVVVTCADGGTSRYDSVVFACNADQALRLLDAPTADESRLLGAWRYRDGRVVVHSDYTSFPRRELMQAYTFLYKDREGTLDISVNGALWHEPGVPNTSPYICSQHPNFAIADEKIDLDVVLRTPVFDSESCATIAQLPSLNGVNNTYYCGSHFGCGLHNDAVRSAINVAAALGVPFALPSSGAMRRRSVSRLMERTGTALRGRLSP